MKLWIDFETRSRCDLKARGVYNYAQDASTEVLCMSYAFDDGDVVTWLPGDPFPDLVRNHTGQIRAHNAAFERLIFWYVLQIDFKLAQFYCTASQARANCAPGSLEDVGRFAGAGIKKDHKGSQLIRLLSIPQADGQFRVDPAKMAEMVAYCEQDVRAMRAFSHAMRDLSADELADYHVNERINDRGVLLDLPLAQAAVRYAAAEMTEIQEIVSEVTQQEIVSVRSVRMKDWVWDRVGPESQKLMTLMKKGRAHTCLDRNVRASLLVLADENPAEVPPDVAEVIQCADDLWASSVAKFSRAASLADEEDHRVRGAFVFAGGAATGRASSYGLQVHNFPRVCADDPETVRQAIVRGHQIVPLHGKRVTDVLKRMLRPSLMASPGKSLVVADWASVEARVTPWASNRPAGIDKLDMFRAGEDIYKVNAAATYRVAVADVTKAQRQVGKVQELACLSEDTLVLTACGEKAIQDVQPGDQVWDGHNWVHTDGAVYKGEKHVLEYDGLCATPDHLVWVEGETDAIEFGRAAANGLHLVRAWAPHKADIPVACKTSDGGKTTVRELELEGLQILWGERRDVQLPFGGERVCMGVGEPWGAARGAGIGPDRQRQGLRAGELTLVDQSAEPAAHVDLRERIGDARFPADAPRGEIRRQHHEKSAVAWADLSADRGPMVKTKLQTKRRVWDLLNCGPLHRFTASGRLVHNCGFAGGVGAFAAMGRVYSVVMAESEARRMVNAWRLANPWSVPYWQDLERAYTAALRYPGDEYSAGRVTYYYDGQHLWYILPSGRVLCYPFARLDEEGPTYAKAAWKPAADATEWPRARLWKGLACENITQAIAHDLLRDALRRLELAGHEVVLHVHDEIVLECQDAPRGAKALLEIMRTPPAWAEGLPLDAEVATMIRYGK
jgi:DNA polymerase